MEEIQLIITALLVVLVHTLNVMPRQILNVEKKIMGELDLRDLTEFLTDPKMYRYFRRSLNPTRAAKARSLYKKLTKNIPPDELKKILRQGPEESTDVPNIPLRDEQAQLVETELKTALLHKKSALYDRPYVEQKGRNEFLVMQPDTADPYVTVIPNSIYYSIEKKCVNWLDDCSLQGIRARLLSGVRSPYK